MNECMTQEDAMNMSDEQAVQILKPFRDMMIDRNGCPISDAVFALDKAIVALSKELPSAQPERKKGKWISKYNGKPVKVINGIPQESCACSLCGKWLTASDEYAVIGNYCPYCGSFNGGTE